MLETFLVVQTLGMAVYVIIILIQSVWEKINNISSKDDYEDIGVINIFSEDNNFFVITARKKKDSNFHEAYIANMDGEIKAYVFAVSEDDLENRIVNKFKKLMKEEKRRRFLPK